MLLYVHIVLILRESFVLFFAFTERGEISFAGDRANARMTNVAIAVLTVVLIQKWFM